MQFSNSDIKIYDIETGSFVFVSKYTEPSNIIDRCYSSTRNQLVLISSNTIYFGNATVSTSINPLNNQNSLNIFPNPASTHIYITNNNNDNLTNSHSICIVNSLNQTIFKSLINHIPFYLDLSTYSMNGIYFVKIIDNLGNVIETKKLIKQ